jgi:hypothetical protein
MQCTDHVAPAVSFGLSGKRSVVLVIGMPKHADDAWVVKIDSMELDGGKIDALLRMSGRYPFVDLTVDEAGNVTGPPDASGITRSLFAAFFGSSLRSGVGRGWKATKMMGSCAIAQNEVAIAVVSIKLYPTYEPMYE